MSRGSPGFQRRRRPSVELPPGQDLVQDFPVRSAGPTPAIDLGHWELAITSETDQQQRWDGAGFQALPSQPVTLALDCVTPGPSWPPAGRDVAGPPAGGLGHQSRLRVGRLLWRLSTNLPLEDLVDHQAGVVVGYDGQELAAEHGGPVGGAAAVFVEERQVVHRIQLGTRTSPAAGEPGLPQLRRPWLQQRFWGD